MKATIDFDPALYRRLKLEAVRRGRTVRDLVAEGVQLVLAGESTRKPHHDPAGKPQWLGMLRSYSGNAAGVHGMDAVRRSIMRARTGSAAEK